MSALSQRPEGAVVGEWVPHESAALHVTGRAIYTDDLTPRTKGVLHAWPVQAPHAHARVTGLRPGPAYDEPGVVRVLTADDVPGANDYRNLLGEVVTARLGVPTSDLADVFPGHQLAPIGFMRA